MTATVTHLAPEALYARATQLIEDAPREIYELIFAVERAYNDACDLVDRWVDTHMEISSQYGAARKAEDELGALLHELYESQR